MPIILEILILESSSKIFSRGDPWMNHEFEYEFRMVGLKIAYYRKANNLTQEQLAEKLGTSTSYIGSIESKMFKPISLTTLFRIAKALDVPPNKLLEF